MTTLTKLAAGVRMGCGAWSLVTPLGILAAMALVLAYPTSSLGAVVSYDGGTVIKRGDPEYAEGGTWEAGKNREAGASYYTYGMDNTEARKTTSAGASATWTPKLTAGTYRVYFWHIVWGARGNVTIEIRHNGKTDTLKRDTGDGHSGWNSLGDYDFAAGADGYVKVTLDGKGPLYADAVKFLPADKVDKTAFPPYPKPDGSTPRAEKGNVVVCGQPRLILYGETLEETVAQPADVPYYGDLFDKWRRQEALGLQREDVDLAASALSLGIRGVPLVACNQCSSCNTACSQAVAPVTSGATEH